MDSILTSIKKSLGIAEEYEHFDPDIIMHINSVFMILSQLGAGPAGGFFIKDKTAVWSDFMDESDNLEIIKSYMYLKVKALFDPSSSSAVMESANRLLSEFEWRINVEAEKEENQNG